MNPIALGMIVLGIILLVFGISSLLKSKKTQGLVFSIVGLLVIAVPFVVSYFLAR